MIIISKIKLAWEPPKPKWGPQESEKPSVPIDVKPEAPAVPPLPSEAPVPSISVLPEVKPAPEATKPQVPGTELGRLIKQYMDASKAKDNATREEVAEMISSLPMTGEFSKKGKQLSLLQYVRRQISSYTPERQKEIRNNLGIDSEMDEETAKSLMSANALGYIESAIWEASQRGQLDRFEEFLKNYVKNQGITDAMKNKQEISRGGPRKPGYGRIFRELINKLQQGQVEGVEGTSKESLLEAFKQEQWGKDYKTRIPETVAFWNDRYSQLIKRVGNELGLRLVGTKAPISGGPRAQRGNIQKITGILDDAFRRAEKPEGQAIRIALDNLGMTRQDMLEKGGRHYLHGDMVWDTDLKYNLDQYLSGGGHMISLSPTEGSEGEDRGFQLGEEDDVRRRLASEKSLKVIIAYRRGESANLALIENIVQKMYGIGEEEALNKFIARYLLRDQLLNPMVHERFDRLDAIRSDAKAMFPENSELRERSGNWFASLVQGIQEQINERLPGIMEGLKAPLVGVEAKAGNSA